MSTPWFTCELAPRPLARAVYRAYRRLTPVSAGIFALLLAFAGHADTPSVLNGAATVIDGDTIEIGGVRLELFNIDAPEIGQTCGNPDGGRYPCGRVASQYLSLLIGGRDVTCRIDQRRKAGGLRGKCAAGVDDLNKIMVTKGWALVRRQWKYDEDYLEIEARARELGRGVWRGDFIKPWRWTPSDN